MLMPTPEVKVSSVDNPELPQILLLKPEVDQNG